MEVLGDFEFYRDQPVGKGGGGEVYRGRQISLNRPVAIKFLSGELTSDASFIRRFHREAECLAKLTDEHIVQIYGAGEYQNAHYYVMEYVAGVSLEKFIQRNYRFSFTDVIHIGVAVVKALKTAWESEAQIIHRDIKPSNMIISFSSTILETGILDMKQARIKVMDFGLAKAVKTTAAEDADLTMPGTIVGTPKYISPEQALGKTVDIRSDIYSLGVVLYEITTGKPLFDGETLIDLLQHHIHTIPPLPHTINPQIPPELEAVILKCLRKNPTERYNHPAELLDDLLLILQKQKPVYAKSDIDLRSCHRQIRRGGPSGVVARPNDRSSSVGRARPQVKRSRKSTVILVPLFFIVSLGYLVYVIASQHPYIQTLINPNTEPAIIGEPSPKNILGDNEVKIVTHMDKDINNLFDYGIKIQAFIENTSAEMQIRKLRVELDWKGKTYIKQTQITLSPKTSNTFTVSFYEPSAVEEYYTYRVLLIK